MADNCSPKSLCDGDRTNNYWIEGGTPARGDGVCMLDNLSEEEVIYHIQHNRDARRDLARVTSDPEVLKLLAETPDLPTREYADAASTHFNRHADSIPYYSLFRGQPPFNQ